MIVVVDVARCNILFSLFAPEGGLERAMHETHHAFGWMYGDSLHEVTRSRNHILFELGGSRMIAAHVAPGESIAAQDIMRRHHV